MIIEEEQVARLPEVVLRLECTARGRGKVARERKAEEATRTGRRKPTCSIHTKTVVVVGDVNSEG